MTDLAVSRGILAQPGTAAFLVIFGMAVILFFVFRSMAKHLRKINMAARAEAEAAAKAQAATGAQESQGPGDPAAASDASAQATADRRTGAQNGFVQG